MNTGLNPLNPLGGLPVAVQGWQCPICGQVYSPTMPMCFTCTNRADIKMTNGTGKNPQEFKPEQMNMEDLENGKY